MTEETTQEQTISRESRNSRKSVTPLAKMFVVVFVAAFIGAFGGVYMAGSPLTGNMIAADAGGNGGSGGNAPSPTPAGGTNMAALADDDPVKGSSNALVTIVEFSDYECPFCERSWQEYTGPGGPLEQYINDGKVRFIYRDFPLSFHPQATPAAEAAECSRLQNPDIYYDFHDGLFAGQGSLGRGLYVQIAGDLGLNVQEFETCIDTRATQQEVQKDFADGSAAGVSGTPTFFINGQKIVGAQPWQVIEAAINANI